MTLGALSVTCLGVGLTACNSGGGNNKPAHHWSTEWSKDDVNHWHECTDDNCNFIYQIAPHDFTNGDCVCGQPKPSTGKPDDGSGDNDDKDKEGLIKIEAFDHTQNGSRVTQRLQKLFKVGDAFNTTNLIVEATVNVDGQHKVETLNLADVKIQNPNMTTEGEKTVVIKYGDKETSYKINVIDLSGVSKNAATGAKWTDESKTEKTATGIDATHTNLYGAKMNAYYIANAVKSSVLALAANIKTNIARRSMPIMQRR